MAREKGVGDGKRKVKKRKKDRDDTFPSNRTVDYRLRKVQGRERKVGEGKRRKEGKERDNLTQNNQIPVVLE